MRGRNSALGDQSTAGDFMDRIWRRLQPCGWARSPLADYTGQADPPREWTPANRRRRRLFRRKIVVEWRMAHYLRPGVYVEEVGSSWAESWRSPEPLRIPVPPGPLRAGTGAWLAEHSYAAFVGLAARGAIDTATLVTSWEEYARTFGDYGDDDTFLFRAVSGFFTNGGTACWVVRVAGDSPADFIGDAADRTGIGALEAIADVSTVCAPDVMALREQWGEEGVRAVQLALLVHCELMGDRIAILDPPPNLTSQQVREWRTEVGHDSQFAALYYPWLRVASGNDISAVPPCGHVAGLYARTDLRRGPQHSAANEVVRGTYGPESDLLAQEQEFLHPYGINALVTSAGRGLLVWGARTMSSQPVYRYLSRRRLMNFIGRNIRAGTSWVIFESTKDSSLFGRVQRDLDDLFALLWRSGALYGETAGEAYFVKCDESTTPAESRDQNQLIAECAVNVDGPAQISFRVVYYLG
jgi:phage tail sheath protein FI